MIDRFASLDIDERAVRSICTIPSKSPVFEGHFPGYPMMPGVLLIECMAQTVGWLVSAVVGFAAMPILAGVKESKFRTPVFPGDTLEFSGKLVHEGSGFAIGECKGSRDGAPACEARITYRLIPYPNPQFRQAMCQWAEQLGLPIKELAK